MKNKNNGDSVSGRRSKERGNRIKCLIFAIICYALIAAALIVVVTPPKYDVVVGDIAVNTIVASKDVVDEVGMETAQEQARNSVQPVFTVDSTLRDKTVAAVSVDFSTIESVRNQAVMLRQEWLDDHPDAAGSSYSFETEYIDVLLQSLPVRCEQTVLLVLIDTNPLDLQAISDAVKTKVNSAMLAGIRTEDLINTRTAIIAALNAEYGSLSAELRQLAKLVVEKELISNTALDEAATENAREAAAALVDEEDYRFKKNQNIVQKGEIITQAQIAMLQKLGMLDDANIDILLYIGIALLTGILMVIIMLYLIVFEPEMLQTPRKVLMLCILLLLSVGYSIAADMLDPHLGQVAVTTILIAVLLKPRVALVANMVLSVILGVLSSGTSGVLETQTATTVIISFVAGSMAIFVCNRPMHRMRIMLAGVIVGATGALTSIMLGLMLSDSIGSTLISALWVVLGGVISAVLCVGTLPLWEVAFGILTPTRLLETVNPNQSLLRRLALEAPGTHHHSIVVANLAESGAQAIGANAILARAGAYYHDVGKLISPEAYTENQGEGQKGFHSMLTPAESAAIIKAHPTEGYELAVKAKLPPEICEIIASHHGTTVVGYFYAKALENEENVNKDDYTYPGPKPQSKEAAIIMLADSIEAAVRSIPDKTPENVKEKINQIVRDRIANGQFDECDLSMSEINRVTAEFAQALSGVHHQRVQYPDLKKAIEDNMEKEQEKEREKEQEKEQENPHADGNN